MDLHLRNITSVKVYLKIRPALQIYHTFWQVWFFMCSSLFVSVSFSFSTLLSAAGDGLRWIDVTSVTDEMHPERSLCCAHGDDSLPGLHFSLIEMEC